jgi:signal transduction histidine kinase
VKQSSGDPLEQRVLVLAPTKKDARLTHDILAKRDIAVAVCESFDQLLTELARGAAAILLTEEATINTAISALVRFIDEQPPWADLPILILTSHSADTPHVSRLMEQLGNVALIERPTRINALVSAVHTALRARARQYQVRNLLDEQRKTAADLQAADRRKDQFLATLAHELRNPLAPIRNSLQTLRLIGSSDPQSRQLYDMMDRQINHMVRLVDDLLELSRITRGQIEMRKEVVAWKTIIDGAEEISQPYFQAAHHQFIASLPAEPLYVHGDIVRLTQVVANLLNNAAKYTDERGRIELNLRREGEQAVLNIRDNGIGIPLEMQPHIFEMFAQVDRKADRIQGGLGIGLTLARTLIKLHGGNIFVLSAGAGMGSEFTIRLPLCSPPASIIPATPAATPKPTSSNSSRPRVLVVDDNRDAAKSLGLLLKFQGAEVQVVNDGPAALDAIREHHPQLVLLDLGMPDMDGFDVAESVRAQPELDKVMLVALTGWGQEEDRRRTRAAGFNDHLVKPPDLPSLQRVLATCTK